MGCTPLLIRGIYLGGACGRGGRNAIPISVRAMYAWASRVGRACRLVSRERAGRGMGKGVVGRAALLCCFVVAF